jgi:hypothetical protein
MVRLIDGQVYIQTNRGTYTQIKDEQIYGQTDRQMDRSMDEQTYEQTDRWTKGQTDTQTDGKTDRGAEGQRDRQTEIWPDEQTDR